MWLIVFEGQEQFNIIKSFSYFQLFLIPTSSVQGLFLFGFCSKILCMNSKEMQARELFKTGYNCAQSVFCAFCNETGMDFEDALKFSSSFGGGMGRLREVCGAVSAMFMIAGCLYGYTEPDNDEIKGRHYKLIQELAEKFKKEHGTIICRELLGLDEGEISSPEPTPRTKEYYDNRPCENFIATAAKIVDELIKSKQKVN